MRKIMASIAFVAINLTMGAADASECTLNKDIDASRLRWSALRRQPVGASDGEKTCRALASSFYEAVTLRLAAARCLDGDRNVASIDSEIDAFNDLLARSCRG